MPGVCPGGGGHVEASIRPIHYTAFFAKDDSSGSDHFTTELSVKKKKTFLRLRAS